ncbi:MAG: acylphosphatase [Planctomycetaceae bacterium]
MTDAAAPHESSLRRRYVFHGEVQGVGFRATAASIARRHPMTGYVRNRADGTVELVLDGPERAIEQVLEELGDAMRRHIDRRDDRECDSDERFDRFEIRR